MDDAAFCSSCGNNLTLKQSTVAPTVAAPEERQASLKATPADSQPRGLSTFVRPLPPPAPPVQIVDVHIPIGSVFVLVLQFTCAGFFMLLVIGWILRAIGAERLFQLLHS